MDQTQKSTGNAPHVDRGQQTKSHQLSNTQTRQTRKIPPTEGNAQSALTYLSADIDRDSWFQVLAAVKSALGDDGKAIAEEWSKTGQTYNKTDFRDTWKSIKVNGGTTIATLWRMARDAGWEPGAEAYQESEAERLERERRQAARQRKQEAKEARNKAKVIQDANRILELSALCENFPYLVEKDVQAVPGLHVIDADVALSIRSFGPNIKPDTKSLLIIPMYGLDGELCGLEAIDADGNKGFLAGCAKGIFASGAKSIEPGDPVAIVEGLATGLTILEATEGIVVIVAFDAGSLKRVAKQIKAKHQGAEIMVCGDRGKGQGQAEAAAKAVGGILVIPDFTGLDATEKDTDFNDLARLAGVEDVKRQINHAVLTRNSSAPNPNDVREGKENFQLQNQTTLPTLPAFSGLPTDTNPTPGVGFLTYKDPETEQVKRIIDSEAARIMAVYLTPEFAYNAIAAAWHKFTGTHWQLVAQLEPDAKITELIYIGTEPIGFRQNYLNGVINILTRGNMLPLPSEPRGIIPFRNGLLDMATRQLAAITRKNAYTWCIPHDYKAGAGCQNFLQWLRSALDEDEGLVQLIRAFINACLIGRADLQKFLFLLGPGGTGKSTFLRLLFALLGDANCITTDLRNLEQNRFESALLYGKRLAAITDAGRYTGAVDVLKAITGQDAIRREEKHKQSTGTFTYGGMVIIAGNEPLASTDYTSGLDRRRLVINFDRRFNPAEKAAFEAAGGEARLHAEIPAIINWALELTREEVTDIFAHPPEKSVQASFEALTAQNPVAEWISENLIADKGAWTPIGVKKESKPWGGGSIIFEDVDEKLYPNYLRWCSQNKREALALRRFRLVTVDMCRTLNIDVIESRRGNGQGIQGIRIKHGYELVQDDPTPNAGFNPPESAPVLEVSEMQNSPPTCFEKTSDTIIEGAI